MRVSHIIQQRKLTFILCVLLTCSFVAVSLLSYYSSKKTIHLALVEKELPLTSNAIYAELQKDFFKGTTNPLGEVLNIADELTNWVLGEVQDKAQDLSNLENDIPY